MDDPRRFLPNMSGLHPLALPVSYYAQPPQAPPAFVAPMSAYGVYQVDGRLYSKPVAAGHMMPGAFPYPTPATWSAAGSIPVVYMNPYQPFHPIPQLRDLHLGSAPPPPRQASASTSRLPPNAAIHTSTPSTAPSKLPTSMADPLRPKDASSSTCPNQPQSLSPLGDLPGSLSSGDSGARPSAVISEDTTSSSSSSESSSWGWLLEGILQQVLQGLPDGDIKHFRQVCKHWRDVSDQNLEKLSPSCLKSKTVLARFPRLKCLQLVNCPNVRNRDLFILSQGNLPLELLTIGDENKKPWVTNRGLSSIAQMTSIRRLSLHDCNSVTNKGLACLVQMKSLRSLSLRNCKKITNNGLEVLQHLTALTSLNLIGCVRISDKALLPLMGLKLESVHLGLTRIRDEGMAYLAKVTTLRDLHCTNEDMSDAGVKQLTTLSKLERLALRECCDLSRGGLLHLLPSLVALTHLDLYKNWEFDDDQLTACIPHLSSLRSLDLRGTWVTDDGIAKLQHLALLESLSLAPHMDRQLDDSLCVISLLTQLSSLTVNSCEHVSHNFLRAVRCLSQLKSLNLSDEGFSDNVTSKEPLHSIVVEHLACLTTLTALDLSKRPVREEQLALLAASLPRLQVLTIYGCPLSPAATVSLQKRFPHLTIHSKDHPLLALSTSLYPSDVRLVVTS